MTLPHNQEAWYTLGQAYRQIRVEAMFSQQDIATRLGLTPRQVNDMEHGRLDPEPLLVPLWECMGGLIPIAARRPPPPPPPSQPVKKET